MNHAKLIRGLAILTWIILVPGCGKEAPPPAPKVVTPPPAARLDGPSPVPARGPRRVAKGGNASVSDAEVRAAVDYMVSNAR